ncbi:SGNH/GDSL hydrolase family protein [Kitasatospora azatica]|uniref:SGNH/GDSL hydrolase family protein n=1 Tax=Kitasatospora azatica TaxID=58347 RepID=UPI000B2D388E|nr:SGNH/GDSL hydrolase family protein [Kitasatospora azatica]
MSFVGSGMKILGLLAVLLLLAGCSGSASGGGRPAAASAVPGKGAPSTPAPSTPAPSPPAPTGPYVALGDSYTSGLQLEPAGTGPKGCGRSTVNYPSLVAQDLRLTQGEFTDVSCSSATTADLTAAQRVDGGANPPQLDALNGQTRLVTVGIGGNDAEFMKVVERCAEQGVLKAVALAKGEAPCKDSYTAPDGSSTLSGVLDTVGVRLAGVLQEVARRAPQARVYVVGYPALLPTDPAGCLPVLGRTVAAADLVFLAEQEQRLNAVLSSRAREAKAGFVDTYTPSAGHDMCADRTTRWIEPPFPAPGRAPLHPNAAGQQGMAQAVLRAVHAGQ